MLSAEGAGISDSFAAAVVGAVRGGELELTADYLEKRAEEKERERAEKERLREERKVQEELDRERARLQKEHQHYSNVLARYEEQNAHEAIAQTRAALATIESAIESVDYRVANVRAGYVYVISNVGAFGEGMIKVGLTRRLDPTERVRELGDASVPFKYDTHALVFSDDAVGLDVSRQHQLIGAGAARGLHSRHDRNGRCRCMGLFCPKIILLSSRFMER